MFVGKSQGRAGDQRTTNSDPLLLTAGNLVGKVIPPLFQMAGKRGASGPEKQGSGSPARHI